TAAILTRLGDPMRPAVRLPPGRSAAVHGPAIGTSVSFSRPIVGQAAGATPRMFRILRDTKSESSPGTKTAAFFSAAIDAKFVFALAAPLAGAAHVPGALVFGRTSPTWS